MTRTFSPAVINGTYLPYPLHGSPSRDPPRAASSAGLCIRIGWERAVDKESVRGPARGLSGMFPGRGEMRGQDTALIDTHPPLLSSSSSPSFRLSLAFRPLSPHHLFFRSLPFFPPFPFLFFLPSSPILPSPSPLRVIKSSRSKSR